MNTRFCFVFTALPITGEVSDPRMNQLMNLKRRFTDTTLVTIRPFADVIDLLFR